MEKVLTTKTAGIVNGYNEFVVQCFSQLRSREKECLELVDLADEMRRNWKKAAEDSEFAEERYRREVQEKEKLKEDYEHLREIYHDTKARVSSLLSSKDDLQKQLKEYEQRVKDMRMFIEKHLKDTAQFGPLMNMTKVEEQKAQSSRDLRSRSNNFELDGVDFDKTGEDEDIDEVHLRYNRTYQRRSKSVDPESRRTSAHNVTKRTRSRQIPEDIKEEDELSEHIPTPPKRARDSGSIDEEITTITKITTDIRGRNATRASVEVHRNKKRSVSESRALEQSVNPITPRSFRLGTSTTDLRSPLTAMGSSWTKGRPILECTHYFENAKLLTFTKNCFVCNKSLMMKNICRCKDCNIIIHNSCRDGAPMPCIPFSEKSKKNTPQKNKRVPRLVDLCPVSPPLVPAVLIRLVYAIEQRITYEGIYRVPGNKDHVESLLNTMTNTSVIPQLNKEHPEVLTSTLKKFLNILKEPIIPTSSYNEFIEASRGHTDDRLYEAIAELPYPNRDTLAFLIIHFQKVAKFQNENKMPIENLAKCIGITVMNGRRRDGNTLEHTSGYEEADRQRNAMERLLRLPEDYWLQYLDSRMLVVSSQVRSASRTPRFNTPRNADQSMLGPVSETPPLNFTPTLRNAKRRGINVNLY